MFGFRDSRGVVEVAFTDRHGGASRGTYSTLNLALFGGDDPTVVAENLRRVVARFSGEGSLGMLRDMEQVHGREVAVASDGTQRPVCDGLVTRTTGLPLMVRVADCVPVLLADPGAGVIGAAHAGRQGLMLGIVPATVATMRDLGATELVAWVGPHICGGCYEVPAPMRDDVASVVPQAAAWTTWGTPSLDVGAGVRAQLLTDGVEVVDVSRCTRESDDLFSYRRDGAGAGRFAGLIRIRPTGRTSGSLGDDAVGSAAR